MFHLQSQISGVKILEEYCETYLLLAERLKVFYDASLAPPSQHHYRLLLQRVEVRLLNQPIITQ